MHISFIDDLPLIREYVADRVRAQALIHQPITAIEIGFRLIQAGILVIHFDVRDQHDRDGEWTIALDGPILNLPHWEEAVELAREEGIFAIMPTGVDQELPAEADEEQVAGIFGVAILTIAMDMIAKKMIDVLPLREYCQLDIEEFDTIWAWPNEYEELGKTNLIRTLKPESLAW